MVTGYKKSVVVGNVTSRKQGLSPGLRLIKHLFQCNHSGNRVKRCFVKFDF